MAKKPFRSVRTVLFPLTLGAVLAGCSTLPQPFAQDEQKQIASTDRQASQADVDPLDHPLTLAEAMARALKYNLDHRNRLMEQAVAMGQLDVSRYDMLPKLMASAGYSSRNNESISRAKDSVTGKPSLANPYISSDKSHTTTDLGLSWNILDFGVSYFNAKQNADRVLIASERRRKAMHNLIQDVRSAYWRAACAQKLEGELRQTIAMAEAALDDSRRAEGEKLRNPMDALRYQRTVLENLRILESIQQELSAARIELAALINLPPGTTFRLAEPGGKELAPAYQDLPVEAMEEAAVANNADLREQFYNVRITVAETKKSMLKMFPGLSFNYTGKHDSNSYLINKSWEETGVQLSWNLFNLLSAPANARLSEANEKLAEQKRMTVQMAVLAQVHLARQQYENAYRLFQRSDAIWSVDQRIFEHSANREEAQTQSKLERISNNTAAIVSLLRRYQALAQVYAANGKVQATLGLEPQVGDLNTLTLSQLIPQLEQSMNQWSQALQAPAAKAPVAVAPAAVPVVEAAPIAAVPATPVAASSAAAAETSVANDTAGATQRFFIASFSLPARAPSLNWQTVSQADFAWVASAGEATAIANGRLILGAPRNGKREAMIEWTVSDTTGRPLGQVRHVGQLSKPATPTEWQTLKSGATAALASAQYPR